MSLSSLLTKLTNVRGAIVSAICSKGVELASSATLHECASAIQSISVGSGGAEVTLGYVDSDGHFQPVTFSGSAGISSGSAVTVSSYYTWSVSGGGSDTDPGSSGGNSGVIYRGSFGVSSATAVDNMVLSDGGFMDVYSGGTANSVTVNDGGFMDVYSGGTAIAATVFYGRVNVSSGGTANAATVSSGGYLYVSSGGTANATTVNVSGYLCVNNGGTANSATVSSGGSLYVSSGGTANDTTLDSYGFMYVNNGGTANSVTVNPNGNLRVFGTALAVTSMAGADIRVYEGGYIEYASQGEE